MRREDGLLKVAERLADHIEERFGPGRVQGIPGHQEIEVGLIKLYKATGGREILKACIMVYWRTGERILIISGGKKETGMDTFWNGS